MDFAKTIITNVIPINQIIKFIINNFLSSYLVIKENNIKEKLQEKSGLQNIININDLELNVSNINHKHLLHSPIKLLKGTLGRFCLDITPENKIIITIEDVSVDLMPIFNYYKKYQEMIFNMEKTENKNKKNIKNAKENKNINKEEKQNIQNNTKNQNTYMSNMIKMANKLLTNLEINIKNISIKLFTYEINEKIPENPVLSLFIMNIKIYKDIKNIIKHDIIDPNTNELFEDIFLNNLIIDVDKLCVKIDQNKNDKDIQTFKEIRNKQLTEQEEQILTFFIAYNTIFAMNYKKGPCLTIKLNTKPRIEKYKEIELGKQIEKEKIIEDMNIEINIFEAESIITPHQLFNIQILSQISSFIITLNQNTDKDVDNEKEKNIKTKNIIKENKLENNNNSSSQIFKKHESNDDINDDIDISFFPKEQVKENINNDKIEKEEDESKIEILGHEISKFNLSMNATRIILVLLENYNNESIPKLFSFFFEEEIINNKKLNNNDSFGNYYCYFEDNFLFFKIENIKSINTSNNIQINISSVIAEIIQPFISKIGNSIIKSNINNKKKYDLLKGSIYHSMESGDSLSEKDDKFESAIENTDSIIIENYKKYIRNYRNDKYQSNKFEILIINEIRYSKEENSLEINKILVKLNYIIILFYIKLFTQIKYFIQDNNPIYISEDIIPTDEIQENLNVNLEKRINDSELQLFKNLKRGSINEDNNSDDEEQKISLNDSIDYSEEENNKKKGMKIKLNYISIKIHNITRDINRFDTNKYFYKLFLELIYPNIIKEINNESIEHQSLNELISKDYIEILLNNIDMIYYNISNISKINILFQQFFLKYWENEVIQYNNINKKNNIEENPNIILSFPEIDIVFDFSDKIKITLEKTILDDLLKFNDTFLYGLSMYQIFDKFCGDLYNNKLLNLFDLFGLKNHFQLLKKINIEEENGVIKDKQNNLKINKDKKELREIKKELNNKPLISVGGKIISCVININKKGVFMEKELNLIKIKCVNIGVNLEMFNDDNNNNSKKRPIYNNVTVSINNIFFLIKENPIPKEGKAKYYNLFSKNKYHKYEHIDYLVINFKFRNIKKIREDIVIEEEKEEKSDNEKENKNEEKDLKKKNSKFDIKNSKISLDEKTICYIKFLLNNQVKLDNMEFIIDIQLSEIIFDSFYCKLNAISKSLSDFYIDFTSTNEDFKENMDGAYLETSDLIPICEDRLMIIKCDFNINNLTMDIFLKEDKDQKNWMRLLFLIRKFKFTFNENGLFLVIENNYIYIMKDFNYIYHITDNLNKNNIFDIEDKINNIEKEDSYLKRLGYVELFYNDEIKLNKLEKELNINLGNINIFLCQDSFMFILEFKDAFIENYLDKLKDIFSQDTLNSDNISEELEKKNINNKKEKKEEIKENKLEDNIKKDKKEEKKVYKLEDNIKNDFIKDFEEIDDVFFMDDLKNNKNKIKNINNPNSNCLKNNVLPSIMEENNLKKIDKKDNLNFTDDFTIIETQSSLKRKQLRENKEENSEKYLLELTSLRLYFFSGFDFNFEDDKNKDLDLSSSENKDKNLNKEHKENIFEIESNYLFKCTLKKNNDIEKKIFQKNKRKKNDERDYSNYILINIINLSFKIIDFCYFDFIIDNFFIDDNFEKSLYKKIISKQNYSNEYSKFLICKIDFNKNNEINKNKDVSTLRINLVLPSLDIFVDQLPLNFIIKLLLSQNYDKNENSEKETKINRDEEINKDNDDDNDDDKDSNDEKKINNNENNKKDENSIEINSKDSWCDEDIKNYTDSLIFVNDININLFTINFHYNSHKLSYKDISNKDWLEIITSITDIKELNLKFKKFKKNIQTPLSDVINELIIFWKDDILNNQITDSVLRGFTITRPFYKLYDGIKDLIAQPYISYKRNEGIKKGLKKGVKSFFFSFSSQGLFFGEKIFRGMKLVVYRKTKLTLKKKSLYKKWVYKINKKQHDYEAHYYKSNINY